jgi:hypothetical protein
MNSLPILPLSPADLAKAGRLHAAFCDLHHADWLQAGIVRWLALLEPQSSWPLVVLGVELADQLQPTLAGTIVGVWAPTPVDRFDDLLETTCQGTLGRDSRPTGGFWHFIAVTTHPQHRELRLGRPLLDAALAFVANLEGSGARTLSPAVRAHDLAVALGWLDLPVPQRMARLLRRVTDTQGRPMLPILQLHPASGAVVEAVLWQSRRDEIRSDGVTLRFAYPLEADLRARNKQCYQEWLHIRQQAVQAGRTTPLRDGLLLLDADAVGDADQWLFPADLQTLDL